MPETDAGGSARLAAMEPGAGVASAVKAWSEGLIDTGGRNRLLYYRSLRTGMLDLGAESAADPDAVADLIDSGRSTLGALFPSDDPGGEDGEPPGDRRFQDARRRAKTIRRKALEHDEEQGIQTLYLAYGFAGWEQAGVGPAPNAPVLLAPAELQQRGRLDADFTLVVDGDEWEVNPTLLHVLRSEFGAEVDAAELEPLTAPAKFEALTRRLSELCRAAPGLEFREGVALSTFSYAKLPMVRDLEQAAGAVAAHPLVGALAGDPAAIDALRAKHAGLDGGERAGDAPPKDEFLILDADGTQSSVINAAVDGSDLVVVGPPGTGKSQTIANLIATLAARGKSVLFVAEKRAAIDAVAKRLHAVGLGDLVLDLHAGIGSRRAMMQQLGEALDAARTARPADTAELDRALVRSRDRLTGASEALHEPLPPWGLSPYELQGRLLGVDEADRTDFRIREEALRGIAGDAFEAAQEALRGYVSRSERIRTSAWRPAREARAIRTRAEAKRASDDIQQLLQGEELRTLRRESSRLAEERGAAHPASVSDAAAEFRVHAALRHFKPGVSDMRPDDLDSIAGSLAPRGTSLVKRLLNRTHHRAERHLKELAEDRGAHREQLRDQFEELIEALHARPGRTDAGIGGASSDHRALASALSVVRESLTVAESCGVLPDAAEMPFEELEERLRALDRDGDGAFSLPRLFELEEELDRLQLRPFINAAAEAGWSPDAAARAFTHSWLESVYRVARSEREGLAEFNAEQQQASLAEFREADVGHIAAAAARIRRVWAEGVIRARDSHHQQQQVIVREARKKTRHRPVRELFTQAPDVLAAMKPCWAMSPLVVAQLLPASPPPFDVVIFDEASQIPPADAISSLLRGRQAIVAGDPKQLPPTAFFTQSGDDDDEREADEELLTDDVESILDAMSTLLSSPHANKTLGWHYRSKDERLIAFANHHVYDRRMTTFPGALPDDCISHVEVPFSQRAVQQRGSNSAEVERVVELVLEHARERPGESLGVIAFGSHHAIRIEETLLQARRDRPELDEFFSETAGEPFFVKNLERVQGDERDAIILSVGYGRGQDGRMRYAFGPINQEGGHRRLNVAITRAKRRMAVVSAFGPHDLDPDRIRAEGARLLRGYIAYAASGGADLGRVDVDKPPLNDFERDIQRRLEAAGVPLEPQRGASGYRIDFAAFHPEQPGRPVLAIEADGAAYHSAKSARDRDRLRQEHLERLGWRFHRIWSTEYFRNPEREIERTVAAWRSAVAAADAPPTEPLEEPQEAAPASVGEPPPPQRGPKPDVGPKRPIAEFKRGQIRRMIDWVNSDGLNRTEDEIIKETAVALGFQRRGSRIDAAIQAVLRNPPKPPQAVHRINLRD